MDFFDGAFGAEGDAFDGEGEAVFFNGFVQFDAVDGLDSGYRGQGLEVDHVEVEGDLRQRAFALVFKAEAEVAGGGFNFGGVAFGDQAAVEFGDAAGDDEVGDGFVGKFGVAGVGGVEKKAGVIGDKLYIAADAVQGAFHHFGDVIGDFSAGRP